MALYTQCQTRQDSGGHYQCDNNLPFVVQVAPRLVTCCKLENDATHTPDVHGS